MNIAELDRIVNDGLLKYKAFERADEALTQLKALSQYVKDYDNRIAALKKEALKLEDENSGMAAKIDAAKKEAASYMEKAYADKSRLITDAHTEAKLLKSGTQNEVRILEDRRLRLEKELNEMAAQKERGAIELEKLEKAIFSARQNMKAIMGE